MAHVGATRNESRTGGLASGKGEEVNRMKRAIVFALVLVAAVAPVGGAYAAVLEARDDIPVQAP
jgi:hypothetical protein